MADQSAQQQDDEQKRQQQEMNRRETEEQSKAKERAKDQTSAQEQQEAAQRKGVPQEPGLEEQPTEELPPEEEEEENQKKDKCSKCGKEISKIESIQNGGLCSKCRAEGDKEDKDEDKDKKDDSQKPKDDKGKAEEPGKTPGKEAGEKGLEDAGKKGAKEAGKDVGKQAAKEGAKEAGKEAGKAVAKEGLKTGIRATADTAAAAAAPETAGLSLAISAAVEVGFKVWDFLVKYGKYILLFMAAIALLIVLAIYGNKFKGSKLSEPPDLSNTEEATQAKLAYASTKDGAGNALEVAGDIVTNLSGYLDQIATHVGQESDKGIRNNQQKSTLEDQIQKIREKIAEAKGKITELQELNKKKEEDLSDEEFSKREQLRLEVDLIITEIKQLVDGLKKELAKCDEDLGGGANAEGLMQLPPSSYYEIASDSLQTPGDMSHHWGTEMAICRLTKVAKKWQSKGQGKLYIGHLSLENGQGSILHNNTHDGGKYIDLTGAYLTQESQEKFGVDYNRDLTRNLIKLLWDYGATAVFFNDEVLNLEKYQDITGKEVNMAIYTQGLYNHIHVEFGF